MVDFTAEQTDARLKYLDGARRFFIQIWRQNPGLLKHGDSRLIEMMAPIWARDEIAKSTAPDPE